MIVFLNILESVVAAFLVTATTATYRWISTVNKRLLRIERKLGIGHRNG